jgi:hypothetical protein
MCHGIASWSHLLEAPATLARTHRAAYRKTRDREMNTMVPRHINSVQWQQAIGYARQACARIFRDGGNPREALGAFGMGAAEPDLDWAIAVDRIAQTLCAPRQRKAA